MAAVDVKVSDRDDPAYIDYLEGKLAATQQEVGTENETLNLVLQRLDKLEISTACEVLSRRTHVSTTVVPTSIVTSLVSTTVSFPTSLPFTSTVWLAPWSAPPPLFHRSTHGQAGPVYAWCGGCGSSNTIYLVYQRSDRFHYPPVNPYCQCRLHIKTQFLRRFWPLHQ